ncbi:MAG: hypothetical protein C0518_13605 [Opitutus sp.]|nr:hypothetical protein [Opitutus sp.]
MGHGPPSPCRRNPRRATIRFVWLPRVGRSLVSCAALVAAVPAFAATYVWDGGHPAQDKWSTQQNWNPNTTPLNNGTGDFVFTGSIKLTSEADGAWSVNSLLFDSTAGAFVLSGGVLTIDSTGTTYAIANNSTQLQTIGNDFVLAAAQSWRANTGDLLFNGAINLASFNLTLTGDANTTAAGVLSGAGALIKTGGGTLTLTGANTYSGGTTVSAGTLRGSSTSLQGNITNNSAVAFDQTLNGSFSGVVSGSGSLTKDGAGTLTLGAAQTYTGATTINAGQLTLGAANALNDTTAVTVAGGAALQLAAGNETVGSIAGSGTIALGTATLTSGGTNASTLFEGTISGTGGLVKSGTGELTLTGANTYSGGTTVNAGTLRGSATSLQGNIANQSALIFDQGANGTYGGVISGTGAFTKLGSGTLTLGAANTYTGATNITAGTLALGAANALSDTTAVSIGTGAGLQLASGNETVGSIAGGGSIDLGAHTLTSGGTNASTAFSGVIGGTGGIVKAGSGTLALTGANTYSGGTTVSAGTLRGSSTSLQGNIANSGSLVFDQSTNGTFAGVVSGSGALIKEGAGTLTLSGANTNTGATTVSGGSLALGADNVLSSASGLTLNAATSLGLAGHSVQVGSLAYHTAIIDFGTAAAANYFLFSGAGASTGTLTINNFNAGEGDVFAFQTGASVAPEFISGVYFYGIGGGVLGASGQTLSGYSGTWDFIVADTSPFKTWDGGSGSSNNWSVGANWSGDTAPVSGFSLKLAFAGNTRLAPVMNGSYSVNTVRFEADAGAYSITASGGGSTLTFGGSVPSIIQLSAQAQTIDVPIALNSTTIIETTGAGALTLAGELSGTGGITKVGDNTLILSGGNSYAGATTINAGTVVLRHSTALGATSSGTSVNAAATLRLENNITVGAEALALDGALRNASGANAFGGAISGSGSIFVDGGTLSLTGTAANTYSGTTLVNAGQLDLGKTAGITAVAGDITVGDGTNAATLRLVNSNQIGDAANIVLANGTTVFNLNGRTETIGSLASSNSLASVVLGNGGSLITGGNNSSTTFAGVISGSGAVTKEGAGTFTVSGANTYTGATAVNAGTLIVRNSAGLGTTGSGTTVASGATLQLENNVTVGAEALTLNGTLRSASGTNAFGGAISGSGGVVLDAGTLTLNGTAANTFTGATTVTSGQLDLAKTAGLNAVSGNLVIGGASGSATTRLVNANQISDTAAVSLGSGGTPVLNLNNNSETIGSLAASNAAAAVQLGSGTLTTGGNNSSTTFAGVISGTGGLTKAGTGTFTVTGANTYTGNTTVSAGTLVLGTSNIIGDSAAVSLGSGAALSLAGTSSERIGALSFNSSTIDFGTTGSANHFVFSSVGTISGTLTIANWSEGVDLFGVAVNTVSQAFLDSVFFSNLNVGIGAVLSDTAVAVGSYGNYYILTPIPTFIWDGGQSSGSVSSQDDWSQSRNWSGDIAPATGSKKAIVMAGVAKTTTDMNSAFQVNSLLFRSDAGAFTINSSTGDTLSVGGGGINNQSASTQTLNVNVALTADQTWTAGAGNLVHAGATLLNSSYALTIAGDFDTTISAVIGGGSGGVIKNGGGTLTLSGTNTYTGGTTLNAGVVSIASDSNLGDAAGNLTFNGGTLRTTAGITSARGVTLNAGGGTFDAGAFDSTLSGVIGGTGALAKTGAGTLTLTGANTYTGGTTVSAGTLRGSSVSLQGNIVNNAAVTFDQASNGTYAGVMSGSGSLTKTGAGTLTLSGANTYSGGTTVSAGTLTGTTTSLQGNIVNNATVTFDQASNGTYAGAMSGSGGLTKLGAGTLTLTGTNTFTGPTQISAGTLALGGDNVLAAATALTVDVGATMSLVGYAQSLATLGGVGAVDFGSGGTLTLASGTSVFGGAFSGTGNLIVAAGATLRLGADFNATGLNITLAGGTLEVNGTTSTFGTLSLTGNSIIDFSAAQNSVLAFNSLAIGAYTLAVTGWTDAQDYFYSTVSPGAAGVAPTNQIVFDGFSGDSTSWLPWDSQVSPVPEPSTYGAILMGVGMLLLGYRRWKRPAVEKSAKAPVA